MALNGELFILWNECTMEIPVLLESVDGFDMCLENEICIKSLEYLGCECLGDL